MLYPGTPDRLPARRSQACSLAWDGADEPVWGSAAPARFWLALEQPGPWGLRALVDSRLDPRIGAAVEQSCARAGGRALLIRTVGSHHRHPTSGRRVFLTGGMATGRPWLVTGLIGDPGQVLRLPWHELADSPVPDPAIAALPELDTAPQPVLLVCTNAKRDACCAVRGRVVARDASAMRPAQVWECSHCGGHRFAPTGVLLPSGHTLGRLDPQLAVAALDAAVTENQLAGALLAPEHNRGLSHLSIQAQAADAFIRRRIGEVRLDALTVEVPPRQPAAVGGATADPDIVWVTHRDGRRWTLRVRETASPVLRRNSCATDPVAAVSWQVEDVG